jgi:hypothetical protein
VAARRGWSRAGYPTTRRVEIVYSLPSFLPGTWASFWHRWIGRKLGRKLGHELGTCHGVVVLTEDGEGHVTASALQLEGEWRVAS